MRLFAEGSGNFVGVAVRQIGSLMSARMPASSSQLQEATLDETGIRVILDVHAFLKHAGKQTVPIGIGRIGPVHALAKEA
jgi:hypothetical protein